MKSNVNRVGVKTIFCLAAFYTIIENTIPGKIFNEHV